MPNNFAVVHVDQFLPDSFSTDVRDESGLGSSTVNIEHIDQDRGGSYGMWHLGAIQNPKPAIGNEDGWLTEDPNSWSDGPVLDPTRPDNQRFAYGRFGTRYGKLDRYSGVVISQILGSKEDTITIYEDIVSNSISEYHLDKNIEGSLLIEETEQVSESVYIYQYNFMLYSRPKAFSYKNPIDTDVSIRLSNYVYPLNSGTVTLSLDGEEKSGLLVVPFYSGLGGFDATWTNDSPFGYDEQVDVEWRVFDADSPSNEIIIKYWFRTVKDSAGPRIINVTPADDSVDNDINTCISFTIRDYELGVNINSLELYVNNILIVNSSLTISEILSEDGYNISYCPTENFLYGDVVPVSIYIEDSSEDKNSLFYVFSFTTKESSRPILHNNTPREFSTLNPIDPTIGVVVSDGGSGLDENRLSLNVDGEEESDLRKLPIIYRRE